MMRVVFDMEGHAALLVDGHLVSEVRLITWHMHMYAPIWQAGLASWWQCRKASLLPGCQMSSKTPHPSPRCSRHASITCHFVVETPCPKPATSAILFHILVIRYGLKFIRSVQVLSCHPIH